MSKTFYRESFSYVFRKICILLKKITPLNLKKLLKEFKFLFFHKFPFKTYATYRNISWFSVFWKLNFSCNTFFDGNFDNACKENGCWIKTFHFKCQIAHKIVGFSTTLNSFLLFIHFLLFTVGYSWRYSNPNVCLAIFILPSGNFRSIFLFTPYTFFRVEKWRK